jgi:acyl-coenzyme A thioesterase PaaI-like protein
MKPTDNLSIPTCRTFWQLGSDLNGFPHIAHGGLLAALLDEQMGMLLTINSEFGAVGAGTTLITEMTVYMNVRYRAPVKTPGVVMAVAECTKKEGRKTFVRATVVDETGKECAIGEGMFIEVPETRL